GSGCRGRTSKRYRGCVNGWTPNSGLGGVPVGICPKALRAKGLKPWIGAHRPPAVMRPHLTISRRGICPWDQASIISARVLRAFSASLSRAFSLDDTKNDATMSPPDGVGGEQWGPMPV